MSLLGNRSLAWVLKWAADVALLAWCLLLVYTLYALIAYQSPSGPFSQQGALQLEYILPTELIAPRTDEVEVINFQSNQSYIHYTTPEIDWSERISVFSYTLFAFGTVIWILWLLRQILASLVRSEPLTMHNSVRFRTIGLLLTLRAAATPIWASLTYLRLQQLFESIPAQDFLRLYIDHLSLTGLFTGLLVILMAELMRLGANHRMDSESVV